MVAAVYFLAIIIHSMSSSISIFRVAIPTKMDFLYSEAVKQGTYRDDGLANDLQLRLHRDSYKEIKGTLRAQEDWDRTVSSVKDYHGGLGDHFSFVRVTIPECLPDRLEIVSYANEYAFLYDGTSIVC